MSTQTQMMEHVVLFGVKNTIEPSKVREMVDRINSLSLLDEVLHLTAGPVLRIRSSSLNFTHIYHSRYSSKQHFDAYTAHPHHLAVVQANANICGDAMALDWLSDLQADPVLPSGSVVRVTLLKLKDGLGDQVRKEILEVVRGTRGKFGQISQFSCGENFLPERSEGFSIGSLAVFAGMSELEAVDSNDEFVKYQKDNIGENLESLMVVDYVVPSPLHSN
ncbi:hypothetical protein QN277_026645 [Acacia crassicarpa]|uniref:Stress-response A/B barrel domain-containing protein n=1 Tax=Acacia crassicarpa TaxID=499986 RepID=A0AAE1JBS7_9FABA|nr:hypothetical protein QN277_026645 [Acacia crassicarpa]